MGGECRAQAAASETSREYSHTLLFAARLDLGGKVAELLRNVGGLLADSDLSDAVRLLAELQPD